MFYVNDINRQSLGTKNKDLKMNGDGGVTFYVSHDSPGKEKETNWLPAPKDVFSLYLRFYWPSDAILKGTWEPPLIKPISS